VTVALFAVLVEFDLPEDGPDFTQAASPMMDALRTLAPVRPRNITAFTGEAAEQMVRASQNSLD
jgi:hypothetical protein